MSTVTDYDRTDRPATSQPPPVGGDGPIVQQLVIDDLNAHGWVDVAADMQERWEFGKRKHGNDGLRAGNGRIPVADAYEEQLDAANYLRQAIEEGEQGLDSAYQFTLTLCRLLRRRLHLPR